MTPFMNILASAALATALLPIAANATTMTPPHQMQIVSHQASQVIVQSGPANQRYPDSLGG
jgi:hypothetical protein